MVRENKATFNFKLKLTVLSLNIFVVILYAIWFFGNDIIYYSALFFPSIILKLSRPGLAKSEVIWGVHQQFKKRGQDDKSEMPNIILIIADDLGIHDLSYGSGVETPNIDSIYKNGARFLNSYAGHATCAPSRAALYTGRFATRFGFEYTPTPKLFGKFLTLPWRHHIHQPTYLHENAHLIPPMRDMVVPKEEVMIAENLSTQFNYNTYMIGKWHLGEKKGYTPTARGFDESLCFLMGGSKYLHNDDVRIVNAPIVNASIDDFLRWNLPFEISHNDMPMFQPGGYMTDYLSNESAKLIRTIASTPSANPFFLTLAYNAPHNPLQALKSDFEDPALASIPSHNGRVYAAMIKALDRGVGQVLEALKDTNQWNNTIVVFTSDNGGASYIDLPLINHPYRGWKATFFEGGLRVPLFMQWPAMIDASTEVTQTVSHVDIFPTLFAAAAMMNASSSSSSPESCSEKQQVESAYSKGFFSSFFTFSSPPETNQTLSEMPSYQALITQSEFDGNVQLTALRVIHHVEAAFSSLQIRWEPTLASLNAKIHRVIEIIDSFLARLLTTISVSRPKATTDEYERNESFSNNISSNEDDSNTATAEIESVNGSSDSGSDITRSRAWWPRLLRRMSTDGFCGLVVKEWFCPASVDYDSRTTTAEIEEKPRRNWSDDRKLDGLNLLPHVLRSRKLPELEGLDGQKATHDLAERALFWRSGSYKAIIYSNWKLQVSYKPEKIWFFNLLEDPVESLNLAHHMGLHSEKDLYLLQHQYSANINHADSNIINNHSIPASEDRKMLLQLHAMLDVMNKEQSEPLWPALVEAPILVDKTSNSVESLGDEYVYWTN